MSIAAFLAFAGLVILCRGLARTCGADVGPHRPDRGLSHGRHAGAGHRLRGGGLGAGGDVRAASDLRRRPFASLGAEDRRGRLSCFGWAGTCGATPPIPSYPKTAAPCRARPCGLPAGPMDQPVEPQGRCDVIPRYSSVRLPPAHPHGCWPADRGDPDLAETAWNSLVARIFSLDRTRAAYISLKTVIDRTLRGSACPARRQDRRHLKEPHMPAERLPHEKGFTSAGTRSTAMPARWPGGWTARARVRAEHGRPLSASPVAALSPR
jgi:hypothetical protein